MFKSSILFINFSVSVLAISGSDNIVLYSVGVLCVLLAKLALMWEGAEKINIKAWVISLILSITGGYIGYIIGIAFFLEREMIRLVVMLACLYLGDLMLLGLRQNFPDIFKKLLHGGATALLNKMDNSNKKEDNENIE